MTSDQEGANSVFDKELPNADIVISQPFWSAYLTAQSIAKTNHRCWSLSLTFVQGEADNSLSRTKAATEQRSFAAFTSKSVLIRGA
jgi:hypothetical protein